MKNWIFDFILYIFTFVFVTTIFPSITLPVDPLYVLAVFFAVGLAMSFSKPLLIFLTVKVVFITRMIGIILLTMGVLFLLDTFVSGFFVNNFLFKGYDSSIISLKSFEFDKIGTMALLSVLTGFVSSFVKLLQTP